MNQSPVKVFCHLLLYKSDHEAALRCVDSVLEQGGIELRLLVSDNGAGESVIHACQQRGIEVHRFPQNVGFSAGHNFGFARALDWQAAYFVSLNPDTVVLPGAFAAMVSTAEKDPQVAIVTPKLLRSTAEGSPISPPELDAAGMILTKSLRHFDRGSGEPDQGQFDAEEQVFGGTGACLMVRCTPELCLSDDEQSRRELESVYPALAFDWERRAPLFDEGFFAYREDAELCWRVNALGRKVIYQPHAVVLHERTVRQGVSRSEHAPELNALGVQNRFLLQATHGTWRYGFLVWLCGVVVRNLLVLLVVFLIERSSIVGLQNFQRLKHRAHRRGKKLYQCADSDLVKRWM